MPFKVLLTQDALRDLEELYKYIVIAAICLGKPIR